MSRTSLAVPQLERPLAFSHRPLILADGGVNGKDLNWPGDANPREGGAYRSEKTVGHRGARADVSRYNAMQSITTGLREVLDGD